MAELIEKLTLAEEEDDEVDEVEDENENVASTDKKKRKKKKKKAAKKSEGVVVPAHSRLLGGSTHYFTKYGQSYPPSIPVHELTGFKKEADGKNIYPEGEIMPHNVTSKPLHSGGSVRMSDAEKRELELLSFADTYNNLRRAAEVQRQTRRYAQSFIQPGIKLIDMCERIEECNRMLVKEEGLKAGIAFPTGCSINHVAAHFSPNTGDETVLQYGDVMKVDFGTQIDGRIIDTAWTVAFDPKYDPLLNAVKEATNTGVRMAGIDMQLCEIGEAIQEVMESHEIELNGKIYPIKCCRNLMGHSIQPYKIHGGKSVPIVKSTDTTRMEENEMYAIETFGSTGNGYVIEDGEVSHYMKDFNASTQHIPLRMQKSKVLLNHITKTFHTLAFCRRWLEREDGGSFAVNGRNGKQDKHYMLGLKNLCEVGLVNPYPPLVDIPGSYVAQYEHTLLLRPTCKEILSRGEDY